MRARQKLLIISAGCAGIAVALLLTAVVLTHLLANRERVNAFVVAKTTQATGAALAYDRLVVSFLPLPHVKVRGIQLHRQDAFEVSAKELSVYPRILPILKGQFNIHQIGLISPDIKLLAGSYPVRPSDPPDDKMDRFIENGIRSAIAGFFGALTAIDPGMDLQIEAGAVTLVLANASDLRVDGIDASVENDAGDLSLSLSCRSDPIGNLYIEAKADIGGQQADGQITLTDLNLQPLLLHASLPGGITTEATRADIEATFSVKGPESLRSRFDLRFPSLTVLRNDLKLDLDTALISGSADYAGSRLTVSLDTLQSAQPALDLSASASIGPPGEGTGSVAEIHAAAKVLDIAVASNVTRAIAGDLKAIQTAFSYAKSGQLTDVTYFAGFEIDETGWRLSKMKAAGHLTQGLVALAVIDANLERMDGEVVYEDQHVAFNKVSGHIRGATFKGMDAAIDWQKESTLTLSTHSVTVDAAPLYDWLTRFKGLDQSKDDVETVTGSARLTELYISGPLTQPQQWLFRITGSPENLVLAGPLVPFEVTLSGGKITYTPGKERSIGVGVKFLDGSFVASHQAKGIITEEYASVQIDGSMGQATIDWLSNILSIPPHLQMKPPVDVSGFHMSWNDTGSYDLKGRLKTAGGIDVYADFSVTPQDWYFRKIQFDDGSSKATVSVRKHPKGLEIGFTGNVEKITADHLLEDNQILSGRLEGDFQAVIHTRRPIQSSFSGKLTGEGCHFLHIFSEPIDLRRFSIEGNDSRLTIAPSEVSLCSSLLVVDGVLDRSGGGLTYELTIDADRLDEELIRVLQPVDADGATVTKNPESVSAPAPRGTVHVQATEFTYGGFNWSQVRADVGIDGSRTDVQVHQANLCGISTTGELAFSPVGLGFHITPAATDASFEDTFSCLWNRQVKSDARYDLTGEINLPTTLKDPVQAMSGQVAFSSANGRIQYSSVMMQIFAVLNVTEVFAGGKSDLSEEGYGYETATAKVVVENGKLNFEEILLDGNSLKISGQGSIDLTDRTADIILLAAPLKTVDRIVSKIPIISYITGGSLISVPMRVKGPLNDPSVVPMSPAAVGQGARNIMGRILKGPFRLVKASPDVPPADTKQKGP